MADYRLRIARLPTLKNYAWLVHYRLFIQDTFSSRRIQIGVFE